MLSGLGQLSTSCESRPLFLLARAGVCFEKTSSHTRRKVRRTHAESDLLEAASLCSRCAKSSQERPSSGYRVSSSRCSSLLRASLAEPSRCSHSPSAWSPLASFRLDRRLACPSLQVCRPPRTSPPTHPSSLHLVLQGLPMSMFKLISLIPFIPRSSTIFTSAAAEPSIEVDPAVPS